MSGLTKTQQNVLIVLRNIEKQVKADVDDADMWASGIEYMLSEMSGNDAFGTEGQNDPRGDFRDGEWSIFSEVEEQ